MNAEALNSGCYCVTMDEAALLHALEEHGGLDAAALLAPHARMFSHTAVFVDAATLALMRELIAAIERVVALPAFQRLALADAHPHAQVGTPLRGVFHGYDFHLSASGPQLIEINTNAGGALLNAVLRQVQRACCEPVAAVDMDESLATACIEMFRTEWRLARGDRPLRRIVIVDEHPGEQYLYPEFRLFQRLFELHGIDATIVDPQSLRIVDDRLRSEQGPVDLVYNRLTDFLLETPGSAALAEAWRRDLAVVTPHPRAWALHADKRRLITLSDPDALAALGACRTDIDLLARHVPRTIAVRPEMRERLWSERRDWFFKPAIGYGGRAAYRGAKLTRGVFEQVLTGGYVAQRMVPPSTRCIDVDGVAQQLKVDIRNYSHAAAVQLVCARLYAGQTTNFRTPGGGFAPVYETVS